MNEIQKSIDRLQELCSIIPNHLEEIREEVFNHIPSPGKWSKKQILGHLIDSAANNHQRFVRIQYEEGPIIYYDQNEWNRVQEYNKKNSEELKLLWKLYNLHLLHIVKNIPSEKLEKKGVLKSGNEYSLGWYINDYVEHLEHHLHQIVSY
jgi:DinB superfamily